MKTNQPLVHCFIASELFTVVPSQEILNVKNTYLDVAKYLLLIHLRKNTKSWQL